MMITPGNIESQGNHAAVTGRGIPSSQQPLNARCEQYVNMNAMMNGKYGVCVHGHAVDCRHGMSRHPKTTGVLPACFQVNQARSRFQASPSHMFQLHLTALNSSLKTSHFDSDGDFMRFMSNVSKTRFTAILIKTAVHRVCNLALCGRHRISHVFINAKICLIIP